MNLHLSRDGQQFGPHPADQLPSLVQSGQVLPTDHVWHEGAPDWVTVAAFLETRPSRKLGLASAPARPVPVQELPLTAAAASRNPMAGAGQVATNVLVGALNVWRWIKIGAILVLLVMFGLVATGVLRTKADRGPKAPGQAEFEAANSRIMMHHDAVAFGNSPEAVSVAKTFSESMKIVREAVFTKSGRKGRFSLSDGEFLTYCELRPDRCVFLIHVPGLRKFTPDAQESLGEMAWISAQSVLKAGKAGKPNQKLAVGIRGAVLYDRVLEGVYVGEPQADGSGQPAVMEGTQARARLFPYFVQP